MKRFILVLLSLAVIGLFACKKSPQDTTVSDGFLTGYGGELCGCCPQHFVKIGNDTLNFDRFPPNSPKVTLIYPHPISIEWKRDTSSCSQWRAKRIVVTRLIKI